ncbi:MAG: lycopene cyclase domain-containing protein [Bacteroidota bacterium]
MNSHYTYLLIDTATVLFPLLLSFDKKVAFYKQWKYLWIGTLLTGTIFILWDILFTQWGIWSFSNSYTLGIRLTGLPIEEWLFFFTVPYSCTFIYECLLAYFPFRKRRDKYWSVFTVLGILLVASALVFYTKAYTFSSFIGCGIALMMLSLFRKDIPTFRADVFLLTFLISIVPFLIVNGVLTALPVVIYNNSENLGIRISSIPFEDNFYGMLLMLGNIAGMEWARGRKLRVHI